MVEIGHAAEVGVGKVVAVGTQGGVLAGGVVVVVQVVLQDVARQRVDDPDLFVALREGDHEAGIVFREADAHRVDGEVADEPLRVALVVGNVVAGDGIVAVFVSAIGDIDFCAFGGELEMGNGVSEGFVEDLRAF